MTDKTPDTLWRLADITARPVDCEVNGRTVKADCVDLYLQSEGAMYAVSVVAPPGATNSQVLAALRAAAAHLVSVCGGDPTKLGGVETVARSETKPDGALN